MAQRALLSALFVAALTLPGTAGHSEERELTPVTDTHFQASFAEFAPLPDAPAPGAEAVDLDTFDPPIEAAPATTALGRGIASYYGRRFHGRRTASGERFDMNAMTAAHKTLPFGSLVEVTNPNTGKSVTVRINDRGPYAHGRLIDLSRAAAEQIGLVSRGHGTVELALVD